jgi:dipeptidyl aminopeptidase/acylaminoacyl peptidase
MPRNPCVGSLRLGLFLIAACSTALALTSGSPPPAEAFATIQVETDVVLSPDGHWIAWLDHKEAKPRVMIFDVQARRPQRILAVPEQTKLTSIDWNDNDTVLITVSETHELRAAAGHPFEFYATIAQDVTGGDGRMLFVDEATKKLVRGASLRAWRLTKPKTVLMAYAFCKGGVRCLYEVDTRTGIGKAVTFGTALTTGWVVDEDGRALAREDWDYSHHSYRVIALGGNSVREIFRTDEGERPTLAGLLNDRSAVVLLATNGRPYQAAWALPLDGSPMKLLYEDATTDIAAVRRDPNTDAIVGVFAGGPDSATHWLEPNAQQRFDSLQRAFPGRDVQVYGWTADGQKTLAYVQTGSTPPLYYIVDFAAHRADIAGEPFPALAGARFGEVKEITYTARDGTPIPAYLTLPAEKRDGPMPLVVFPHNGPHSRDYLQFNWIVQFLATRGYAVLQPEFRGSTGFGKAFLEAGYRQWGGLMQNDVTDGVRAMIDQGIADSHRVCIAGIGYGGYVALAGAAFTPDLYACAVSIEGISDISAWMRDTLPVYSGSRSTSLAYWEKHVGRPNDRALVERSPINAVKSVKAPVLVVYGLGESGVPKSQSEQIVRALQAADKRVTVVTLPGPDYWLSRTDMRAQALKELEAFLRDHL